MKQGVGKFSFKVPDTVNESTGLAHPDAGKKIEKAFEFDICENDAEASKVMTDKKWSLLDMVNDSLKANARSNAYQSATIVYRPSQVDPDDIRERMIRDYIRLGIPEEAARAQVEALTATLAK